MPDIPARRCAYEWWDLYTAHRTRHRCTKPEDHDGKHEALAVTRALPGGAS